MSQLYVLSPEQLQTVNAKFSMNFLRKFGTAAGFREFCSVASKDEKLKNCGRQTKELYATYLLNTSTGEWDKMIAAYGNLDNYSQAGMMKNVARADIVKKSVNTGCMFGNRYTMQQLKDVAQMYQIDLRGAKTKLELCTLLSQKLQPEQLQQIFGTTEVLDYSNASANKAFEKYKNKYIPQAPPVKQKLPNDFAIKKNLQDVIDE